MLYTAVNVFFFSNFRSVSFSNKNTSSHLVRKIKQVLKYDSLNKEESLRQKEKKENLELISIFKQLKNNSKNIN
jgi:hypothetical protein